MNIALVAHDNRKQDLSNWVLLNINELADCKIIATKKTGKMVSEHMLNALTNEQYEKIEFEFLKTGPMGGDQELGARITANEIDVLIFLWDPMSMAPHDVDVKALLRLAVLYNVPTACNRSTADYIVSSVLFKNKNYKPIMKDYEEYLDK